MISSSQPVHGFGNPIEVIAHYLLIRGMTCLDYPDEFPMVSALMCMVTQWIGPIVGHDARLLGCHDSLNYYVV